MANWFSDLEWWDQEDAYDAFDSYREQPDDIKLDTAILKALPIIRVVYSTQKFRVTHQGDEDDLISHAALTITKALPKMILKPKEKLDNDKKYMRYLFTCVVNAFYREYDILHGKHNKLQRKLNEQRGPLPSYTPAKNIYSLEAEWTLRKLPDQLYDTAMALVRFGGKDKQVCSYILTQTINEREIAKSVLQLMGCTNRFFFINYCNNILFRAFYLLRKKRMDEVEHHYEDITYEDEFDYEYSSLALSGDEL
ncbi:MAG: hypothetical protein MJA29_02580 [Candidatus Omnitrophica bacterium]|nr:hypothetical protein [Candidatus Omnitrophota bacterium]